MQVILLEKVKNVELLSNNKYIPETMNGFNYSETNPWEFSVSKQPINNFLFSPVTYSF